MMGDIDILSREEWQKVVECSLGNKGVDVLHYTLNRISTTGGFLGHHFTVDLAVRLHENVSSEKRLRFFLKSQPKLTGSQSEWIERTNAFPKEGNTVSEIFSKIRSSLNEYGNKMVWTCKCYYTRPDAIVLEDLSEQGFRPYTLRHPFKYEHFKLTIRALANMHAASIIFEEKQPNKPYRLIKDYPDILKETFFVNIPGHPGTRCMNASVKAVWFLVELLRGKEALEQMKSALEKLVLSIYDLEKPSKQFRNVICQGDMKRDNILFRHEGEMPIDVRIVDYQLTRYAPPANDVMCFLYLSSNKEFRRQNAKRLLENYYDHFAKNLREHGLNPNEIMSRGDFILSCDFYKKLGVIVAAAYAPGTLAHGDNLKHIVSSQKDFDRFFMDDRSPEIIYSYETDDFYRKNMVEIIDEFVDECFAN